MWRVREKGKGGRMGGPSHSTLAMARPVRRGKGIQARLLWRKRLGTEANMSC